ncbi:MAG: phenylalanine--tRNA ligase subunit alpha [Myxococcota bacterium]|nr:phenylalanine--tRNA ligase subunit alpha [Myxococcota bacterium]MEC8422354.1 phenylalanine--tRNA ligase subunit alpha [Myxococcota bacterium]
MAETPDVEGILASFRAELAAAGDASALDTVRRAYTGKKSALKAALKGLRHVDPADRPRVAQAVNLAQKEVEAELADAAAAIEARALTAQLDAEWQDLTLPGLAAPRGQRHPLTVVENRCMDVMRLLGFQLVEGPEVEHPYYNFDALNIPKHHPARDMQDTFWVDGRYLLRSHTTTVQARVLESTPALPVRVCSMGRVYRNEAVDATHLAMFHQFEGIWVDKGLTFGDLKGVLAFIAKELFGDRPVRFKPKFYPYTEPSVGVDIQCGACNGTTVVDGAPCEACHAAGWVTILGSGMIHPKMLMEFGYDPDEVSGIAFGLGTTRMAAQWTGVGKVKSLYEQDRRVFAALHRGSDAGGAA